MPSYLECDIPFNTIPGSFPSDSDPETPSSEYMTARSLPIFSPVHVVREITRPDRCVVNMAGSMSCTTSDTPRSPEDEDLIHDPQSQSSQSRPSSGSDSGSFFEAEDEHIEIPNSGNSPTHLSSEASPSLVDISEKKMRKDRGSSSHFFNSQLNNAKIKYSFPEIPSSCTVRDLNLESSEVFKDVLRTTSGMICPKPIDAVLPHSAGILDSVIYEEAPVIRLNNLELRICLELDLVEQGKGDFLMSCDEFDPLFRLVLLEAGIFSRDQLSRLELDFGG